MMLTALRPLLFSAVIAGAATATASAAEPTGNWLTEGGKATVRMANCGPALCGTIVSLKEPNDPEGKQMTDKNNEDASKRKRPMVGIQIVLGMKPNGPNKWSGQVYNAEDGKTYSGNLVLQDSSSLKLEGCVLGGLICKSQLWTRTN